MFDQVLGYALSFSDFIYRIAAWAANHPEAAAVWIVILNGIIGKIPWRGKDDLVDIVSKALGAAYQRRLGK